MAKKFYEEEKIRAIATKIREKTGSDTTYTTEEMPIGIDEVYNAGLVAGGDNSGSGSGAKAYHLTSVDDLPTDAVDGSLAVVTEIAASEKLGTWVFNDELTDLPDQEQHYFSFTAPYHDPSYLFTRMGYVAFAGGSVATFAYNGGVYAYYYTNGQGWQSDIYKTIVIRSEPDETIYKWITENATRTSEILGTTLYSRENGEWVSKGEI